MGLDMYIFRVSKPHLDDSVVYNREDLHGIILSEEELKNPMYQQLAPYAQSLQVRSEYYDMAKIRKDYGLSESSYICEYSASDDFSGIVVEDKESGKKAKITDEEINLKYTISRIEPRFVCNAEKSSYFRKEYDLQDWIHEHVEGEIENCGFYILSKDFLQRLNKKFKEAGVEEEDPNEEYALFYHEWY